MRQINSYRYLGGGPCIVVEILLPKKSGYLTQLYTILNEGFRLNFENHFLNKKNEIINFYAGRFNEGILNFETYAKTAVRTYFGYSIYEVDGVFFLKDVIEDEKVTRELNDVEIAELSDHELEQRIYEERTQVVKLILKPSIGKLIEKLNIPPTYEKQLSEIFSSLIRFYLAGESRNKYFITEKINIYKSTYPSINKAFFDFMQFGFSDEDQMRILNETVEYTHHWFNSVGFFLIGYIVFEISNSREMKEEEIWFTVNFDSQVYVIKK